MIISIFLFLIGAFIAIISSAFSLVTFIIPQGFQDALTYFFSGFNYLTGIFPVTPFLAALGTYISFLSVFYSIKLILWIYSLLPWIGKTTELPQISEANTLDLSRHGKNTLNLRKKRGKNIMRNTRDIR